MWTSAVIGIATKFFTCSLGIMYRAGTADQLQGGPIYVIPGTAGAILAVLFSLAGLIGTLYMAGPAPAYRPDRGDANVRRTTPARRHRSPDCCWRILVGAVISAAYPRVARVAVAALPTMVVVYLAMTLWIVISHLTAVPGVLADIVREAFSPPPLAAALGRHINWRQSRRFLQ